MIVVTTPTGKIGCQLLEELRDRTDEPVRVIARDPDKLDPLTRERVEVIPGSHDDPSVLDRAFAGADTVFWLVPPDPSVADVTEYYLDFTRPACEAIERHRVKRVVGVTSMGRGWAGNAGHLSAAHAMDEQIERTGVDYRALRLPYFMENLLNQVPAITGRGMFFMPNDADRPLMTIATRDVAKTAADVLLDPSWSGQDGVAVIAPDPLTPNEMAVVLSEVLERDVRCQPVPGEDFKQTMLQYGMTEAWAQGLVDMAAAQDQGIYEAEPVTPQTGPTSFKQWAQEELKPAVEAG